MKNGDIHIFSSIFKLMLKLYQFFSQMQSVSMKSGNLHFETQMYTRLNSEKVNEVNCHSCVCLCINCGRVGLKKRDSVCLCAKSEGVGCIKDLNKGPCHHYLVGNN